VDIGKLITAIVVSPWASEATVEEVKQVVRDYSYTIPVQPSELARYRAFLP
jgi:hypothetical protein